MLTSFAFDRPNLLRGAAVGTMLWATSAYLLLKFLGLLATLAYLPLAIAGATALFAARPFLVRSPKISMAVCAAVMAVVIGLLAFVYPKADAVKFDAAGNYDPSRGSDRDDALDTGARALLDGKNPYRFRTYQTLPISPMPGAIGLATPFVAITGRSAHQIPLWIGLFGLTVYALTRRPADAAIALLLLVPGWPAMLQEIATGGDYTTNALYVLCAGVWLLLAVRRRFIVTLAMAMFVGIALSSRSSFFFATPALFVGLCTLIGWRAALLLTLLSITTFACLTFPFYFADPAVFGPLQMQDKFADRFRVRGITGLMIALAAVAAIEAAATTARRRGGRDTAIRGWLWAIAITVTLPCAVASVLEPLVLGEPPLFFRWATVAVPPMILLTILAVARKEETLLVTPQRGRLGGGGGRGGAIKCLSGSLTRVLTGEG